MGMQATATPPERAGLWSNSPYFPHLPLLHLSPSSHPPLPPMQEASPCFPTLQAPSATSALSLKLVAVASTHPLPHAGPPTPTLSQRARAAMTRYARPTTTLTRHVRVPAQDTANGTPQRIKSPHGYPACHVHHCLPGAHVHMSTMTQLWTMVATTARRHRHDGGDDSKATSP
ncbi:hypothetical protein EDB83DRAFT_2310532 [Lactarius deliciosus]|nr:hypothetical protein EDB83DRAFT_2310532 [Lactarius deliciosus]